MLLLVRLLQSPFVHWYEDVEMLKRALQVLSNIVQWGRGRCSTSQTVLTEATLWNSHDSETRAAWQPAMRRS